MRFLAWIVYTAIFAGGIFIIADELNNSQPADPIIVLIGCLVALIPAIATLSAIFHRVDLYHDHIISRSILGTNRVALEDIQHITRSLDYMNIHHKDTKVIILPSYLCNTTKLYKHLKEVCTLNESSD